MRRAFLLLVIMQGHTDLDAQLPTSQLFLLSVQSIQDTPWTIKNIAYLTAFNEGSYSNQPYFASGDILLASVKRKGSLATDIYRFDIGNRTIENLTSSQDHEYSPRINPSPPHLLTYVRVPKEDSTVQDLIEQDLSGDHSIGFIFKDFAKIGYYRVYKDRDYICFLVDEPHKLGICNQEHKLKKIFASNIGRCFEVGSDGRILYVDKSEPTPWKIKKYDPLTQTSVILQTLPPGSEDFALDHNSHIYCTYESKIMRSEWLGKWSTILDLTHYGLHKLQRIAIHNNRIALVNIP